MKFGFVSTRFSGTDGVSLESRKWAEVLERDGHGTFWFCGLCDHPAESSFVVAEAHFEHPEIEEISRAIWHCDTFPEGTTGKIARLQGLLHSALDTFCDRFEIDVLIPENAITIPMNLPLGLAVTDFIEGSGIPTITHHHDFYWERERFSGTAVQPFLRRAFPPVLPGIVHAVINSAAAREVQERFGIDATIVPNVMDFSRSLPRLRRSFEETRASLGLDPDDRLILQPTRVVPRKGIEHAIELVHRLGESRNKLLISHEAGDEGLDYRHELTALAKDKGVDLRFVAERVAGIAAGDDDRFSLEDLYPIADFVTFPSLYEGFGNALLEAIYFKKPVLVNRYSVFKDDIEGCGFELVTMDGEITEEVVEKVRRALEDSGSFEASAERNFEIAAGHFGYAMLERRLREMVRELMRR
jgi:glycosyltransferase involved in cell wall biosynthesis